MNWVWNVKITRMIVILKKNEEHILVIWLIEWNKDNDSSGKKSPNLYSPAMNMHDRPSVIMVTYAEVV